MKLEVAQCPAVDAKALGFDLDTLAHGNGHVSVVRCQGTPVAVFATSELANAFAHLPEVSAALASVVSAHTSGVGMMSAAGEAAVALDALVESYSPATPSAPPLKTFLVWETEYPGEGSVEVEAASEDEAIASIERATSTSRSESRYTAEEATPRVLAIRRATELLESEGIEAK